MLVLPPEMLLHLLDLLPGMPVNHPTSYVDVAYVISYKIDWYSFALDGWMIPPLVWWVPELINITM